MYRTVKNGRHSCWNGSTRIRENLPSKIIEWVEKGSLSRNTDRNLTPTKKKKNLTKAKKSIQKRIIFRNLPNLNKINQITKQMFIEFLLIRLLNVPVQSKINFSHRFLLPPIVPAEIVLFLIYFVSNLSSTFITRIFK